MKNRIKFLFIILLISKAFSVGEAGAVFLLINPGSSAAGAGEAQVAKVDDAYASYYNPAGLGFLRGKEVVMQHVNWLPNLADDIFYDFLAYRQSVPGLGTFGGHLIYLNLGEQQGMDAQGNATNLFKSYMMAFNLSYGTQIAEDKSVGMNFKVFYQKLADDVVQGETGDPYSTDFAFDIGYLQKFGKNMQHQFGFSIQNIGPPIDFIDSQQADPAPTNMKFGIYSQLYDDGINKINLLFDANKLLVASYPAMDWNGDGIISGSKEESHIDPWYKGVFTAWLDDWYYGGDYDLCEDPCGQSTIDKDIVSSFGTSRDNRIGGYYEIANFDYINNENLYATLSSLDNALGEYADYWSDGLLFDDIDNNNLTAFEGEYLTSIDWFVKNNPSALSGKISKLEDQIVYVPNYSGFCNEIYTPYGGNVYAEGVNVDWHGYSLCYDSQGESSMEPTNLGSFNDPTWIMNENDDFDGLAYIDLPHDGLGDFDVFDPACDFDQNYICDNQELNGLIESPQNGEAHFDVEVNDNGEYSFSDSEYGVYNAHGNFEKGTGDQREFKNELEEMIYNFGLEWEYTENFVMRVGFIYDLEGDIKNPTFGAGLNFNNYGFDFGYTAGDKGHPRENTMFFSLSMGL
tara:strand:+ start:413 stop:2296 length:1884 start_codon:yes stop_codon:yes gene_type:complete